MLDRDLKRHKLTLWSINFTNEHVQRWRRTSGEIKKWGHVWNYGYHNLRCQMIVIIRTKLSPDLLLVPFDSFSKWSDWDRGVTLQWHRFRDVHSCIAMENDLIPREFMTPTWLSWPWHVGVLLLPWLPFCSFMKRRFVSQWTLPLTNYTNT